MAEWQQFKEEKVASEEEWRCGVFYNLMQEIDVCWMTTLFPWCQIGREWNALFQQTSYSTNWPVVGGSFICPCVCPFLVMRLRTAMRKMPDATSDKVDMKSWIPGSPAEDLLCACCCLPCTICHIGRELKFRQMPTGTILM